MHKLSFGDRVFDFVNALIMIVLFVVMVFPFLHIINYSISDFTKVSGHFLLYPRGATLESYRAMFQNPNLLHSIFISVARTVVGTSIMVFFTSMAGYVVSRDDMLGIKYIRKFFVFTMYFSVGLIPMYLLIQKLGLTGTFWVYVIPGAVGVFNMILIKTYVESLPKELEDAAFIDGASDLYLFFRIIFPLSAPVVAAISLFSAIGQWNSFVDTQFYNAMNPELFPLSYVLYIALQSITSIEQFQLDQEAMRAVTPETLKMAMTVITVLPIMVVYPFLQKHFMKGMLIGSIKG